MAVKAFVSTTLLLSIIWLKSIQAIDCSPNCYSVQRIVTTPTPNIYCYEYRTTISSDPICSITGSPILTFYTNNQCDISEMDLSSVITDPVYKTIVHNDIGVGIQLPVPTSNEPIRICVRGTFQTTTALLTITDDTDTCREDFTEAIDFCDICNGNDATNTCFCHNNENDCTSSIRPRGDLTCFWDPSNNECHAFTADVCASSDPDEHECVCFWNEDDCAGAKEEGTMPCDWDSLRAHCIGDQCIGDNLACPCMKTKQDCENEIIDFPTACLWDNEECVEETTTTTTTNDPTEIPTMIPTVDPYTAPTRSPVVITMDPTMDETTTTWRSTSRPTPRNTPRPTPWRSTPRPTYWNKPTKKPGKDCGDGKDKGDNKGNGNGNKGNGNGNKGNGGRG